MQHQTAVTLKLVQVYVIDKKGNPVVDLEKEDFLIRDNGQKKQITEFERHILDLSSLDAVEESGPSPYAQWMKRKFFLLFDFAFNNTKGIKKAKKAALHFLDTQVQPTDEVGVLSYTSIKSLTLHEYLTSDHNEVRKVVEAFGVKDRAGRAENFEEDYWFRVTGENPLDASKAGKITFKEGAQTEDRPVTGSTPEWDKFHAQEDGTVHVLHFVQRIKDFAEALKYIPGYKHIILFSSGIPYSLVYGIQHPTETWDMTRGVDTMLKQRWDFGNTLIQERYDDMLKALTSSNSTVYAIDTEDLSSTVGVDSRLKGGYTLQTISSSTGGKYFGDVNSYEEHLEQIQNMTGCFYVLGYYIDEKWDGDYHEIKVKANRPGLEVHAQKGYFNPKTFDEFTKIEKQLHLVDLALNERSLFEKPLRFPMISLPCSIQEKTYIAMFTKLPREEIQELSGEDMEIVSIVFDTQNSIVKIGRDKMDFTQLPAGNIYYSNFTSLYAGEYKCRIVIRNLETGKGAVASASVMVLDAQDQGLKLFPPLLINPEEQGSYIKEPPPVYPFHSNQYFPLVDPLAPETERILCVLRCSYSGIKSPDIHLSASLIRTSGETGVAIPTAISIRDRYQEGATEIFLLEIQTAGLLSGEYFLYFFAKDSLSPSKATANTTFSIEDFDSSLDGSE
ncbi:MAG: VWA domain-containing protein [Candidatus Aminicenantes bacterium]|nr:VWA domain-containing protein [Candidatus Aminicenantes bacterium]